MKNLNFENFEKLDLPFKVNRLSPNIGAELLDIDLRQDLDKKTYEIYLPSSSHLQSNFFS